MPRAPDPAPLTYALLYCRVSSQEQAREGVSLDTQLAECQRYAAAHGWVFADDPYIDVLSGSRDDRPAYRSLLENCRAYRAQRQAAVVVVLRLDRLGRRLLERVRAYEELEGIGVPIHSVREGGVVLPLVANVLAAVAQEEIRLLGARVSETRQHLARQGWWSGGQAPWGYQLRSATAEERAQGAPRSVLAVDPAAAPFVVELVARIVEGESLRSAVAWLHTLPSAARAGRRLAHSQIRRYLQNDVWRGQHHGQPARWPAIIDAQAGAALDARAVRWARGQKAGTSASLLTGLIRCPWCGGPMAGTAAHGGAQARYRCYGWDARRRPNGQVCHGAAMVAPVDADVLRQVGVLVRGLVAGDSRALERRWRARELAVAAPAVAQQQASHERAKAQAQRRLAAAAVKLVDGDLDRQGYALVRAQAEADLAAAAAGLAALPRVVARPAPAWATVRAGLRAWARELGRGDRAAARRVLLELVEAVRPVRTRRGVWVAEVTWTPLGRHLQVVWGGWHG